MLSRVLRSRVFSSIAKKSVLVPIADGTEEIEAITVIDLLRRANINVLVSSVMPITTIADNLLMDKTCLLDGIILPGGLLGADNLFNNELLREIIKHHYDSNKLVAAICASPAVILDKMNIFHSKKITCYPSFKNEIKNNVYSDLPVVLDENISIIEYKLPVTAKGVGQAIDFGLEIIKYLQGETVMNEIKQSIVL